MKGSAKFTQETADEIVVLLGRTRNAERSRQKALRQRIRDLGFFISDWERPGAGFRPDDFRELVLAGRVEILKPQR